MADKTVRGRFVWDELYTPDKGGAHAFYSKAFGWKAEAWEQDPTYSMFAGPSGPLGAAVEQQSGAPRWLPYIATTDIDATVQQATSLGGRVTKEITPLPTGSKYAEVTDPQGAAFGVYWSETHNPEAAAKRGEFSWRELAASDYQAAFDFYAALFGWTKGTAHDMGPLGVYLTFSRGGKEIGGIYNKPAEMQGPPAWCGYVRVKDVQQAVKKIKAARGTLVNGPMEVPGGDWIAQFVDPYGAFFAVHGYAADLKAAAPAAPAAEAAPAEAAPAAVAEAPAKAAAKPKAKPKAKPAAKKKAAAKKKPAAKKKAAAKKKRPAAKSAKRPARKAAKKAGKKKAAGKRKSPGGKKKTAKKPRKGK